MWFVWLLSLSTSAFAEIRCDANKIHVQIVLSSNADENLDSVHVEINDGVEPKRAFQVQISRDSFSRELTEGLHLWAVTPAQGDVILSVQGRRGAMYDRHKSYDLNCTTERP